MAKITLTYKEKTYEFTADNADQLLKQTTKALGIANLALTDLGLTAAEHFTADKEITLNLETQFVRGKTYIVRKLVQEEKGSYTLPANEHGELHPDNAATLFAELAKEPTNNTLVTACLTGVTKLNLSDCNLNVEKLRKLKPYLTALNLTEINLSNNPFRKQLMEELCLLLEATPTLRILRLNQANIYGETLGMLTKYICSPACLVKILYLNENNRLGDGQGDVQNIVNMIEQSQVQELYLQTTHIGSATTAVASALQNSKTLKILNMRDSGCCSTDEETLELADALPYLRLRQLYLYDEFYGLYGVRSSIIKLKNIDPYSPTSLAAQDTIAKCKKILAGIAKGLALNKSLTYLDVVEKMKAFLTEQQKQAQVERNNEVLMYVNDLLKSISVIEGHLERNANLMLMLSQPTFLAFSFSIHDNASPFPTVLVQIVLQYLEDDIYFQPQRKIIPMGTIEKIGTTMRDTFGALFSGKKDNKEKEEKKRKKRKKYPIQP